MKTIFDLNTRVELIHRVNAVDERSTPVWGKMTSFQMLKHCTLWDEWVLGVSNTGIKQSLLGRIFGKMALRNSVKDDRPMQRNMPAGFLKVNDRAGDFVLQKQMRIERLLQYENFTNDAFVHDFFGKMTREQIGIFAYKHADHHLRQFGC